VEGRLGFSDLWFDIRLGPFSFLSFLRAELLSHNTGHIVEERKSYNHSRLSSEKQEMPNRQTPFWRIGSNRIPKQTTS